MASLGLHPYGTGTLALLVESALILVVLADAVLIGMRSRAPRAGVVTA